MGLLFIDNGAYEITAIYTSNRSLSDISLSSHSKPVILSFPNCSATNIQGLQYIGSSLLNLPYYHRLTLRRPIERGILIDAALQATIWAHSVLQPLGIVSEADVDLILTCPQCLPQECAKLLLSLCFGFFHFQSVTFVSCASMALNGAASLGIIADTTTASGCLAAGTAIVVDCGHSSTVVTPFLCGRPVTPNIIQIDVGGSALTNFLMRILSFSQVRLTDDTWIVNVIKERCCSVAPQGLSIALRDYADWNSLTALQRQSLAGRHVRAHRVASKASDISSFEKRYRERYERDEEKDDFEVLGIARLASRAPVPPTQEYYALPTVAHTQPVGCIVRGPAQLKLARNQNLQLLHLRHERLVVPEALFHPSMIDISQIGVAEAIVSGLWTRHETPLYVAPSAIRSAMNHIIIIGGSGARMSGFGERLMHELSGRGALHEMRSTPYTLHLCSHNKASATDSGARNKTMRWDGLGQIATEQGTERYSFLIKGALETFFFGCQSLPVPYRSSATVFPGKKAEVSIQDALRNLL